jgi:hypothetical protein
MVESFNSDETLTQGGTTELNHPEVVPSEPMGQEDRMAVQSQSAVVWELLDEFWGAIWRLIVGRFTQE